MLLSLIILIMIREHLSKSLLFDLDGTLTDSQEGIINAVKYALDRLSIQACSQDMLVSFIGPPLRETFTQKLGMTNDDAEKGVKYYREYYIDKGMYESAVYAGIPDLLQHCKDLGFKLFVATAKPEHYAGTIIEHFGLDSFFTDICGTTLDATRDNKTAVIGYLLHKHRLHIEKTIMIGDREHDVIGAHHHKVLSIAVGYGYGSSMELRDCSPSYLVNTVDDLKKLISTIII